MKFLLCTLGVFVKRAPLLFRIKSLTYLACWVGFLLSVNTYGQDDWIYNLNSPATDADGNFSITWSGYGGDLFLDCLFIEIEIRRDGRLYDSAHINNCGRTSYQVTDYPDGSYRFQVSAYVYDSAYDLEYPENGPVTTTVVVGNSPAGGSVLNQDFEQGLGWTNTSSENWYRDANGTPSGGTGPSSASQGSWYVYLETSANAAYTAGETAALESPTFEAGNGWLAFDYHMYGADTGVLKLQIRYNNRWIDLWTADGQQQNSNAAAWATASVPLTRFTGPSKLRFVGVAAGGYRGDMAIDNIRYAEVGAINADSLVTQQGYDFHYRSGDINGDGRKDLYIHRTSGDVENGVISQSILQQNADKTFTALTASQSQLASAQQWGRIYPDVLREDLNFDGKIDLTISGLSNISGFAGADDQFVFSSGQAFVGQALTTTAIDEDVRTFFWNLLNIAFRPAGQSATGYFDQFLISVSDYQPGEYHCWNHSPASSEPDFVDFSEDDFYSNFLGLNFNQSIYTCNYVPGEYFFYQTYDRSAFNSDALHVANVLDRNESGNLSDEEASMRVDGIYSDVLGLPPIRSVEDAEADSAAAGTLNGPAAGVWDWLDDIAKIRATRLNWLLLVTTIPGSTPQPEHRGRVQAQGKKGDGTEESVPWARRKPPTVAEGLVMLEVLKAKLTKKELEARTIAFQMAERYILNAGETGGVVAQAFPNFADPKTKSIRVDIEVIAGVAFVPVPTP